MVYFTRVCHYVLHYHCRTFCLAIMGTDYKSSTFYQDHMDPTVYLSLLSGSLSADEPEVNPVGAQVALIHELMRTGGK